MNDWRHKIRQKKALGIALACCLAAAAVLGYYCCWKSKGKVAGTGKEKSALDYRPDYQMRIERLRFYGMKEGRRVFALVGDSFVIEKKRIGFLTISVAHVARLDNAHLDLYDATSPGGAAATAPGATGRVAATATPAAAATPVSGGATGVRKENGAGAKENPSGQPPVQFPGESHRVGVPPGTPGADARKAGHSAPTKRAGRAVPFSPLSPLAPLPSYGAVFSEEAFHGFPVPISGISAIEVAPITVRLFNGDLQTSQLTATRAELRFKHRDILCEGQVRIVSGRRELRTESLVFQPEKGRLQIRQPYTLIMDGKVRTGERLTTDVYLRPQGGAP
ncbi:MAG: hypothetical protein QM278_05280 [Pseudomonadota bacterium]|nr:hypothetical protein [Pseudomonadota bacterium]